MPTATRLPPPDHARRFALRAIGWSVVLFGALRLRGVENLAVLPLTLLQGRVAANLFGPPAWPIDVTLACSGADAIALCAGFILAYPARWPARIGAAAGGIGLILALNTVRIGTLGLATSQGWFELLHFYAWPALLTLTIAGYVFTWMGLTHLPRVATADPRSGSNADEVSNRPATISRRFVLLVGVGLVLFTASAPVYLESPAVLALAGLMAHAAARTLQFLGVEATAAGNVLRTARGGFLVTPECIATPLIPIYLAGVIAYATSSRQRMGLLLAALPLFIGLGIVRLLVVALPAALVDSPLVLVHAFYQLLLAGVIVWLAAVWRHGAGRTSWRRAAAGVAVGAACTFILLPYYPPVLASAFPAAIPPGDPQGAMTLLPAFQVGLYGALCVGVFVVLRWRLLLGGLALLGVSQVVGFAAIHFLQGHADVVPQVRDLRAWALAGPLCLIIAMVTYDRPRR